MTSLAKIKFYRDGLFYNYKLYLIFTTFILGTIIYLIYSSCLIVYITLGTLMIEYIYYKIPDGHLEFLLEGDTFYLKEIIKDCETIEKIVSMEFSWHYKFMPLTKRGGTFRKYTHVNFDELKMIIELSENQKIVLLHELHQWQSKPRDWPYRLFYPEKMDKALLVGKNIIQLKKLLSN